MLVRKVKHSFILVIFSFIIMFSGMAKVTHSEVITVKQLGGGNYDNIGDAISNAFQDDIIEVYAGRYEEEIVIDKSITLKGMGPQNVIIDSPTDGITVNDYQNARISGFAISAANNCIKLNGHQNTVIKNCCIASCGNYGILVRGYYTTATMSNNTIAYSGNDGIEQTDSSSNSSYITNNIIYRNSNCGIHRNNGAVTIFFNDVHQNNTNYCNCDPGLNDISEPPMFLYPPINSCILQSASPCLNAGSPGYAHFDPDGSRNDIGTYGGPSCASFWPYPPGAPIITHLNATPTSVPKGSTVAIEATGEVYE